MKPKSSWKRGAILLQTLVMSVLLSLIAVMVLKWVLARYMVANRIQASAKNAGTSQGYAAKNVNSWNINLPTANTTLNGKPLSFTLVGTEGGGSRRYNTTVTDDY